jgi:signal transduction histidine kinase
MGAAGKSLLRRIARTPLLLKLVVVDAVVNLFALMMMRWVPPHLAEEVMLASLFGVMLINAALVAVALQPLKVLEDAAGRVSHGELSARAVMPWLTDRHLGRIGDTFNGVLDRLAAERARVRLLAGLVVAAGDAERSRIARELHDGTAQSLSALDMLLTSTLADGQVGEAAERLQVMQTIVGDALMEVRSLAQGLHPRVLDDLGLVAALEQLARQAQVGRNVVVAVHDDQVGPLPAVQAAVLYRVAQEALHNAVKYSEASRIDVRLTAADGFAEVRVRDDGVGFDREGVRSEGDRRGMGLFVMEERVSLVDGSLRILSAVGRGTEVTGRVPLVGTSAVEAS